jgi:hypothetical protein
VWCPSVVRGARHFFLSRTFDAYGGDLHSRQRSLEGTEYHVGRGSCCHLRIDIGQNGLKTLLFSYYQGKIACESVATLPVGREMHWSPRALDESSRIVLLDKGEGMTEPTRPTGDAAIPEETSDAQHVRDVGSLVVFSTAAASIAAVIQLVTLLSLDRALTIVVSCFSVAIPINIAIGLMLHPSSGVSPEAFVRWKVLVVYVVGLLIAFSGFTSLFWHVSWIFGVVFLISTLVAVTAVNIVAR